MSLHHSKHAVPPIPTSPSVTNSQSPSHVPGQQKMGNHDAMLGNNVPQNQQRSKGSTYPSQPSTSTAPEKPVFKMRRTGFSGPVPLASPSAPGAGDGIAKANPSPLTTPLTATHPNMETASGSRSGANPVSIKYGGLKEGQNVFLLQTVPVKEAQRHGDASKKSVSRQATQLQSLSTADGLDRHHPIELIESDAEMADSSTTGTQTPATVQAFTPSATQPKDNALDDKAYRTWTDELGLVTGTYGALLPPGYQKSSNATFPWICPVRTCRKMLPSLIGLGKHFCNTHRAGSFNDNMDGTLTDLGTWTDPTRGDGKAQGGSAKPPIIVSKKALSLAESPMVDATLHYNAKPNHQRQSRSSLPAKGGPRRSLGSYKARPRDNDSEDSENDTTSDHSVEQKLRKPTQPVQENCLEMANPDRRYDAWHGKDGILRKSYGALFPDGYVKDTTLADRQWICPVRSCRRLYKAEHELGHHFKSIHRGSLLNDNQDGTLSILTQHQASSYASSASAAPMIISRNPDDSEPILGPQRPTYRTPTNIAWISAFSDEVGTKQSNTPQHLTTPIVEEAAPVGIRNDDRPAYIMATRERKYSEWTDPTSGTTVPVDMAGALIPEGYKLDTTFLNRSWICPIRTCRITCRLRQGLGNHFSNTHSGHTLNDNGDGTFSIVGSYRNGPPKVVSRDPLSPDAPPIREAQFPDAIKSSTEEEKQNALRARDEEEKRSSSTLVDPDGLWRYISKFVKKSYPHPPQHPGIKYLLRLPRVRDLVSTKPLSEDLDLRQIASLIIQVTGKEHDKHCTTCRRHATGPFEICVNTVAGDVDDLRTLLGSYVRSCANCLYLKLGNQCSVKAYVPPGMPGLKVSRGLSNAILGSTTAGVDGVMVDNSSDDIVIDKPRRSRRQRSPFVDAWNTEDMTSNDGNQAPSRNSDKGVELGETPSEPRSKLVTLKHPDHLKRRSSASTDPQQSKENDGLGREKRIRLDRVSTIEDSQAASLPTQEDVEMEDWEHSNGKLSTAVPRDGPSGNLAFSSTHLLSTSTSQRRGRTIQISEGVTFVATHIPSGTIHKFEADASITRLCSLANGKVRVKVDAEAEFAIGGNGMFRINPGVGCTVFNRAYVDAVVHVTGMRI